MAGQVFKKGAAPDNSAYFKADDAYNRLKATLSSPGIKQDLFWPLLAGPLNFMGAFICSEAACQLQVLWEDEVLVEVTGTSDQMDLNQLLFGPDGHAAKFLLSLQVVKVYGLPPMRIRSHIHDPGGRAGL